MKRLIKLSLFSLLSALIIVGCSPEQFGDPLTDKEFAKEFSQNPNLAASKKGKNGSKSSSDSGSSSKSKSGSKSQSASASGSHSQSSSHSSSDDGPGTGLNCACAGGYTSLKFSSNSGGTVNIYDDLGNLIATFPATKPLQEISLSGQNGQPLAAQITIEIVTFSGVEVIVLDLSCTVEVLGVHGSITVTERTDINGTICT